MERIKRAVTIFLAAGLASVCLRAQNSFEAISIRESKPDSTAHVSLQKGRLSANAPLWVYITTAWHLMLSREQIDAMNAPLPKWTSTDKFEINAVAEGTPSEDQMRLMLQSLLAARFRLKVHFETVQAPVLALMADKRDGTGPKLRPHSEGLPCDVHSEVFPPVCEQFTATGRPNRVILVAARNVTIGQIAAFMTSLGRMDRPVVDQTGFHGRFDFSLEFTPTPKGSSLPQDASVESQGTTFQEAVEEQLGLKLRATTAALNTLVVDHVEKPSAN
ncbi:MAG TPA: TIGR03435 family protein [Verrucomicrobiae bacterium]|nr:TIGR03435 family protein [Verrucomicrobiae bacterium]